MKSISWRAAAVLAATIGSAPTPAHAGEEHSCASRIDRTNVVACALAVGLAVQPQRDELEAREGRKLAVSPLLPSNPLLTFNAARRRAAGDERATNWSLSVAQELEIAGQRGARRAAADAEVEAQTRRVEGSVRALAADAWSAFFDALAAREAQDLATRLAAGANAVAVAAHARADQGLIAPVDADVADAAAVRLLQEKIGADRRLAEARAMLLSLLGIDPGRDSIQVEGELDPLPPFEATPVIEDRPDVQALDAERRAEMLRADALRRGRVPNPTLSAFIENDGFDEQVIGLGLSLPIPLPGNVGPLHAGEIAEAEARARRATSERDLRRRQARLEIVVAAQALQSRRTEVDAFAPKLLARANQSLQALARQVEAGRLAIREAVAAQQALVQLLQANIEARRALCLASVAYARAAGMPLEGRTP